MAPMRIQRKRTRGWKMPPNTVYVGRPTVWGNKFKDRDNASAKDLFRHDALKFACFHPTEFEQWIAPLRGKNLACWCALDAECHADVLLQFAND